MKTLWIVVPLLLVATVSWAADDTAAPATAPADSKTADTAAAKPAPKKQPGMMEKTGNAVKSGYHKTVHTLKKHGRKAPCTQAEKSMHECGKT